MSIEQSFPMHYALSSNTETTFTDILSLLGHGFEQAQASLSVMLPYHFQFHAKSLELMPRHEVYQHLLDPQCAVVIQTFEGDYQGALSLVLAKTLGSQILMHCPCNEGSDADLINEMGNILLNSVLRSFFVLMHFGFSSSLPQQPSKNGLAHYFAEAGLYPSEMLVIPLDFQCQHKETLETITRQLSVNLHMKNNVLIHSWFARLTEALNHGQNKKVLP
jgi:chemotaxis protein CheY-P-specific phosphatase CheC